MILSCLNLEAMAEEKKDEAAAVIRARVQDLVSIRRWRGGDDGGGLGGLLPHRGDGGGEEGRGGGGDSLVIK